MEFGCNSSDDYFSYNRVGNVSCNASSMLQNTELPCGDAIKSTDVSTAAACCADCQVFMAELHVSVVVVVVIAVAVLVIL